ncbi:hypothetical protein [Azonexus sp. IMCC34839]|uniref:hypothetical protein n=1 Tax=Azonexus sp. IMCC34839 TaxID=3133695 RepID=UPI00399BE4A1
MFLYVNDIAKSREHTLSNLRDFSVACFTAANRLSELLSVAGRDALLHSHKQWAIFGHDQLENATQFPAPLWLENSMRASKLLDSAFEILGETHKAMIRTAEVQVRVFDEMVFASIQHAEKSSPWEAEIALKAMRTTLETAEHTLHSVSAAAIETVELAEQESHQLSGAAKPARKRSGTTARTN